jgi:hypothetical protein
MESIHVLHSIDISNTLVTCLILGMVAAVMLVKFGRWIEQQLHDAEIRRCKRAWTQEIRPGLIQTRPQQTIQIFVEPEDVNDDVPGYDVPTDVKEFMIQQDEETQRYIRKLRNEH